VELVLQATFATGVAALVGTGLGLSNLLRDRGVPRSYARYVAPWFAGAAILVAVLSLEAVTAILLAAALTVTMVVLKSFRRTALRGVQGDLATQAKSEITFGLAGTTSLAIGWGLLGDPWLGFLPVAFMAWGDSTAGIVRAKIRRSNVSSAWPSIGMAMICLAVAFLYQPFWIGAAGAVVATIAERKPPRLGVWWDDNAHVVAVSLVAMIILTNL
jgi:dolichol kinase